MDQSEPVNTEDLEQALRIPVGTLSFQYTSPQLFDRGAHGILFEKVAGQQLFRLERQSELLLHFYHSSPGTGTRVATIDLSQVDVADAIRVVLTWSPSGIGLSICPCLENAKPLFATGNQSDQQIRVGADGQVFHIGGTGVLVDGVRFTQAGKNILEPTAIEAWRETIKAIEILSTGTSQEGFIYEVVQTNLTISMLVTGFEAYTKKRFTEMEMEGIPPILDALISDFYGKLVRDKGVQDVRSGIAADAQENGRTVLAQMVADDKINFQNFENCKRAYNKAYGVRFGEIPEVQPLIVSIRQFIRYRHKIIHVSPLLAMLAKPGDEEGSTEPVFANAVTGKHAKECFGQFIEALHAATLRLGYK